MPNLYIDPITTPLLFEGNLGQPVDVVKVGCEAVATLKGAEFLDFKWDR